jgi:serine protease inhibitor
MIRFTSRTQAVLALTLLTACTSSTDSSDQAQPVITALPRALSGDEQIAATATTEFGLALFRAVNARTSRDSNLAVSPISASLALGMLMNGAEGETLDQVRRTLGFGTRDLAQVNAAYKALVPMLTSLDPSVKMTFANAAWFDLTAAPSAGFTQRLSDVFSARVSSLSLTAPATVGIVNQWVSDATNARIPKIVDGFAPGDVAFLLNATYFKGQWRAQFDPAQTRPADFRVNASTTVQVPTMFANEGLVRAGSLPDGTRVGELPFGGDAFVMSIVVPPLGTLESAVDSLTPARWRTLLGALPVEASKLPVQLPKFRLETTRELKSDLAALGMPRPFFDAQLAPMFQSALQGLVVTSVRQRVFVDVNEEGAEAAAATGITVGRTSVPIGLTVDRPFFFAIRERLSGTVLFFGKVVRPVAP